MPGELIHIDVKKLGRIGRPGHRVNGDRTTRSRGIGWEFVHVCIDDCTRLAYVEVLNDERKETVTAFLQRAVAWFAAQGVTIQRVMTDNGSGYRSKLHRKACEALRIRHLFTRPYRPRTNGKAERFIRTLLAGWAYTRAYNTSTQRRAALPNFITHYNTKRPHRALGRQTPAQRLAERNKNAATGATTTTFGAVSGDRVRLGSGVSSPRDRVPAPALRDRRSPGGRKTSELFGGVGADE